MFKFDKLVFGDLGWGDEFLFATLMTITVSILSMGLGLCLAILTVWAKLITNKITRLIAKFLYYCCEGCAGVIGNLFDFSLVETLLL